MMRILICSLFLIAAGRLSHADTGDSAERLQITQPPRNDAFEFGPAAILNCTVSGPNERVQWTEFATSSSGAQISDNLQLLNHPNVARYSLINDNATRNYDLVISPTVIGDGGNYRCYDISDSSQPAFAQLIMLGGPPNCTTNVPASGYVVEGRYYTIECLVNYRGNVAPVMTWTGPDQSLGSWGQASISTNETVWSGVNMNMTRYFDNQSFGVKVNFTQNGFIRPNSASNVPTWNYTFVWPDSSELLHVQWPPQGMYVAPSQASYEIGDVLTCGCDSNPASTFFWRNMVTNELWLDYRLVATDRLVGTNLFQCNANNGLSTADLYLNITINPRTTPTTPTTTPTTTTPPAQGPCNDLTGRWRATSPAVVDLCIEINATNGQVIGLIRNATDPYFIEVRGSVQPNKYDEIGFVGVWPVNIGTQAFTGVCSNCFGTEHLQITAAGRRIGDFSDCADFGQLLLFSFYEFTRAGPPCRSLFQEYGIKL